MLICSHQSSVLLVYRHKGKEEGSASLGMASIAILYPNNLLNTTEEEGRQI